MYKSVALAMWVFTLSSFLAFSGLAMFWWSDELMVWLIWLMGEGNALGTDNVVLNKGGGSLLTNPGAMIAWTTPFWLLGVVQISSALMTIVWLWTCRRKLSRYSA